MSNDSSAYFYLVRDYIPDADDVYADYVLQKKTDFPFVTDPDVLKKQILKFSQEIER